MRAMVMGAADVSAVMGVGTGRDGKLGALRQPAKVVTRNPGQGEHQDLAPLWFLGYCAVLSLRRRAWRFVYSGDLVQGNQELHHGEQVNEPFEEEVFFFGIAGYDEFFVEELVLLVGEIERTYFFHCNVPPLNLINVI